MRGLKYKKNQLPSFPIETILNELNEIGELGQNIDCRCCIDLILLLDQVAFMITKLGEQLRSTKRKRNDRHKH
jgi:hypothetical protein